MFSRTEALGQLSNVSMRAITLLSRFSLLFLAARALPIEEFGLFGLLSALVIFGQYVIGMDFYTYSARQVVWQARRMRSGILISHMSLIVLAYVVLAISLWLASSSIGVYARYIEVLLPLLLFECWGQELGRLLVSLGRPAASGIVLFIRSGAWTLALSACLLFYPEIVTLQIMLKTWLSASACAATLATLLAWRSLGMTGLHFLGWRWLWRGVVVAAPFWVSSMLLRGISFYDRVWFEFLAGSYGLAAYVLYAGIAGALGSFLDAGVYSFLYPKLIARWKAGDAAAFRRILLSLLIQVVFVSVLFILVVLVVLPFVLAWLGKPVYSENILILWILLFANVLMAISMVPSYGLYARGQDRLIFYCNFASFLVFGLSVLAVSRISDVYAVPVGVACCFGFMAFIKWASYFWARRPVMVTSEGA